MKIDFGTLAEYVVTPSLDARTYFKVMYSDPRGYTYDGPLQVKERARKGRAGRMYTPPKTVAFEKKVADWGAQQFEQPLPYPIRVKLLVKDETVDTDLAYHSRLGLVYYNKGDLDNFAKSILDGLNGVAWKDDKQIVSLDISRRYGPRAGFDLYVSRAGLSSSEYITFTRYLKKA